MGDLAESSRRSTTANGFHACSPARASAPPPIWLMRQAGRYLPEYRAVREQAGGFLDLCYTPALAAEVTLQPIRRYGFDAAILFSDILVVPHALGQRAGVRRGRGAVPRPIRSAGELARLDAAERLAAKFAPRLRDGRAPAPGSAARGGADRLLRRAVDGRDLHGRAAAAPPTRRRRGCGPTAIPPAFAALIDLLAETSIEYLDGQVRAGADVLQIFDSWAGALPETQFERWVVAPTRRIVEAAARTPSARAGHRLSARGGRERGALRGGDRRAGHRLRHDHAARADARAGRQRACVQGNLDPLLLVAGGAELEERVSETLARLERHAAHLQPGPRHRAADAAGERCPPRRPRPRGRNFDWSCGARLVMSAGLPTHIVIPAEAGTQDTSTETNYCRARCR